jgi:hypothetical protein
MYGKTASSGVEAMNRANEDIHHRTAVDILNTTLILLKNESTRYNKQCNLAWNHAQIQLIWSWGRRSIAVAREVTRHGQAHPYSWLVTIVSLKV